MVRSAWPPQRLDSRLDAVLEGAELKRCQKLGLETVEHLLRYYPRRYIDSGSVVDWDELERSAESQDVILAGEIVDAVDVPGRRGKKGFFKVTGVSRDGTRFTMSFFNLRHFHKRRYAVGAAGFFFGRARMHPRFGRQLAHPRFVPLSAVPAAADAHASGLLPIYPERGGVRSWDIGVTILTVLEALKFVPDPLPADLRERHGLVDLRTAFEGIHRPRARRDHEAATQRFVFEEAFVLQAELARRRAVAATLSAKPRVPRSDGLLAALDARLPFELTSGQRAVGETILSDLARPHPMQRLLQGEVGSGKTIVALRAMLAVVDAGGQAALLAPTEVLAQQHYRTIVDVLGPLAEQGMLGGADVSTTVTLLTGSQTTAVRRKALLEVASGEAGIVVGTHALLQEKVQFADLGLVVVDEQHRFGVEQRAALTAKNGELPPHVLVMTATPIPRTVAMTIFGDLEISTLTERPAARAPITTHAVVLSEKPGWYDHVWRRVRDEVALGRQAYVVCPRISADGDGDSAEEMPPPDPDVDDLEAAGESADRQPPSQPSGTRPPAASVVETADMLADGPLAGLRVEVLHGKLPAQEKDAVMQRFAAGRIDVLVSTTVIEVGVDVHNASTMVVLDADWFGVSQLHQLRGRIGRGEVPGVCLLVTSAPAGTPAHRRVEAVARTLDGFELSRIDLEQRREGDVLGAAQHGYRSSLRLLKVLTHEAVIRTARDEAQVLVEEDPDLARHPELCRVVDVLYGEEHAEFLEKA